MVNTLGFLSLLFGSVIVLGVVLKILGSIFIFSTKPLLQPRLGEDDTKNEPQMRITHELEEE